MSAIQDLRDTMARLRAPGGCPWDQEQDHRSLCETLVEEVAELLETIDRGDMEHMKEELGDVLLQVVFHAQLASEKGFFDFDDVVREINDKLIRRHPHVFGDIDIADSEGVMKQWEEIKAQEKKNGPQQSGLFKVLPPALSPLLQAGKIDKQIEKNGWTHDSLPDEEGIASLAEDLTEEEAGQLLFQLAAACRRSGIDPESAIRRTCLRIMDDIDKAESGEPVV